MESKDTDQFGAKNTVTEYEDPGRSAAKPGAEKTAWCLAIGAIAVSAFLAWIFLAPVDQDTTSHGGQPAQSGSPVQRN